MNALRQLGKDLLEGNVIPVAETTREGTDEFGMKKAIRYFGYKAVERRWRNKKDFGKALKWLKGCLKKKIPVILCVDDSQHWVCVLAQSKSKIVINDPALDSVFSFLGARKLAQRWWSLKEYDDGGDSEEGERGSC